MTTPLYNVVEILRQHYPYPWARDYNRVAAWLAWYHSRGLLFCVSEDGQTIAGVALLRSVKNAEDAVEDCYAYDPEGTVIFVDFTYGPKDIRKGLIVLAIERFGGGRKWVAWQRQQPKKRNTTTEPLMRVYPIRTFIKRNLQPQLKAL